MTDIKIVPMDIDGLRREVAAFEKRYRRASSELHAAFRWRRRETDDQRRWAMAYANLCRLEELGFAAS